MGKRAIHERCDVRAYGPPPLTWHVGVRKGMGATTGMSTTQMTVVDETTVHEKEGAENVQSQEPDETNAEALLDADVAQVSVKTRTLHTVSAVAASAFAEAGFVLDGNLKLYMREHMHASKDRSGFAEALQKFGVECRGRSTVGIAVVSTTESDAQAWLFEAEGGDDTPLRAVLTKDAPLPSLLLRQVNRNEDYLASHAHGSAVGIDSSEGVSGIRLPDGEEVPRNPLVVPVAVEE